MASRLPAMANGHAITLHRYGEDLRLVSSESRSVPALAAPPLVSPGGDLTLLVEVGTDGSLALVKSDPKGVNSAPLPLALKGPVLASRRAADGSIVVATARAIVRLGAADGRSMAARPLDAGMGPPKKVALSEQGAWLMYPAILVYLPFEGSSVSVKLPLAPGAATPATEGLDQGRNRTELLATKEGDCIVAEEILRTFPVKGPTRVDVVRQLGVSALDAHGKLLGQKVLGSVKTDREWFWKEKDSRYSVASDWGIVRTRYRGGAVFRAIAEHPDGDVSLLLESPEFQMARFDRTLLLRWTKQLDFEPLAWGISQLGAGVAMYIASPRSFDEVSAAGAIRHGKLPPEEAKTPAPGAEGLPVVIAPQADGGWLLIRYEPQL